MAVTALGALAIIALERFRPHDCGQRFFRAGFWTDLLAYGAMQSGLLGLALFALLGNLRGGGPGVGDWPFAGQLAFFVLTHDFYIYLFHRWQHRSRWLWRLHEAHHSSPAVDWIAGMRSHPLEIFINQGIELGAMVFLGADAGVILWKAALSSVWGMWIHSNVDVRSGPLQYLVNGPEMHRWHHAIDYPGTGCNFGTKLAAWDWLFGTAYRPPRKPTGYGLAESFPDGYPAQVAHAFRRRGGGH